MRESPRLVAGRAESLATEYGRPERPLNLSFLMKVSQASRQKFLGQVELCKSQTAC